MFKNRELSIRVHKADKAETTEVNDEDRTKAYCSVAQKLIFTAAVVVYGYVVMDTNRQVKVAKVTHTQ